MLKLKLIIVLVLTILGLSVIFYYLPDIGYFILYKDPTIELVDLRGKSIEGDTINFLAKLKVINNAAISVYLKSASFEIYYKDNLIGTGSIEDQIYLPSSTPIVIDITVKSRRESLDNVIVDLLTRLSLKVDYKVNALVSASFLFLSFEKTVNLSGKYTLSLSQFVTNIAWNVSLKKIQIIGGTNETLEILAEVMATNLSTLDVTVRSADISVYYKDKLLGKGRLTNEFTIGKGESKSVSVYISIVNKDLLKEAIQELVRDHSTFVTYRADLRVFSPLYLVEADYTITGRQEYSIEDVINQINIDKIIADENNVYVLASFNNSLGIEFFVNKVKGPVYLNNTIIGFIDSELNLNLMPNVKNTFVVPVNLNKENLIDAIKTLIEKRSVSPYANLEVSINLFDFSVTVDIQVQRKINLNFELGSSLSSVRYISSNIIEAEVQLLVSSEDNIQANIKITNAVFDVYLNGNKIGRGLLTEELSLALNEPTQLRIRLILNQNSLSDVISAILNGRLTNIQLKEPFFGIEFANVFVEIQLADALDVAVSPINLDINIYDGQIIEVKGTNYERTLALRVSAFVSVSNVYNLPVYISSLNFKVKESELGYIGEMRINSPLILYLNSSFKGDFDLEFDKDKLTSIINKAIEKGNVRIIMENITGQAKFLDSSFVFNLEKNFILDVPTPISLKGTNVRVISVTIGNSPKSFVVTTSFTVMIEGISIRNIDLIDASAQIYVDNTLLGTVRLPINQRLLSSTFNYGGEVNLLVNDQGANKIAKYILQQKPIPLIVKNINVTVRLINELYALTLPATTSFDISVLPQLLIKVTNFVIKPPGNLVEAEVEVFSSVFNLQITNIGEIRAKVYDINDVYLGFARIISIYTSPGLLFKGIAELQLTQEGLNALAKTVMLSDAISLFLKEFRFSATVNGVNIAFDSNEIYLIQLSTNFRYDYNFMITDINALPPGTIFPITATVDYQIVNGLNAPFKVLSATMDIYNTADEYLGKGNVKGPIEINEMSGRVTIEANFTLNPDKAAWFASQVVNHGKVVFKLSNIMATVQIYDYIINVPIKGLTHEYVTTPINVDVTRIIITGISFNGISAVAEVRVNNPFKFPVYITYIQNSNRTITFDIYESQREAHPGFYIGYGWYANQQLVGGKSIAILYPVNVVVVNWLHLVSPPHGSLIPPRTQIYVDALNGKAGMKIYDLYFTFTFEKREIFVRYP